MKIHKFSKNEEIVNIGQSVGADIPFMSFGGTAFVEGIGEKMAASIVEYFSNIENITMIDEMLSLGVKISNRYTAAQDLRLKGQSFVITGTLDTLSREEAQLKLKELGAKTPSSVSKNTNFVVVGANPGSKATKAQELGITILNEEELIKIINGD